MRRLENRRTLHENGIVTTGFAKNEKRGFVNIERHQVLIRPVNTSVDVIL